MKRYAMETVVGIFVVIGIVCVGYMTIKLGKLPFFADDGYTLSARFTSVSGLRMGSPVEIHGIQVGTVDQLDIDQEKGMALVRVHIRKDVKVFDDGSAAIKTSGLIGDKFVKIEPGGSGSELSTGGWITETSSPLDIEDLIGKYAFGSVTNKNETKKATE
ncbi:MAG: outer membrane lipid asymmetry maintenance protein MlaD [Pseudomonadota bacterium]